MTSWLRRAFLGTLVLLGAALAQGTSSAPPPEGRPAGMTLREWKEVTYGAMGDALEATGRDIVYSVSEYGNHEPWEWARDAGAHLWRTTADIKPV